jgi:hypothetical protein
VAEVWAGKNWGVMSTPRIGQEVVVEFLEGDPDRPLITGRVYNAEQMPPWKLPDRTKWLFGKAGERRGLSPPGQALKLAFRAFQTDTKLALCPPATRAAQGLSGTSVAAG